MQVVGESKETGTTISFLADAEIFEETVLRRDDPALALPRDGVS